jgi:hypothetical protein
VSDRTKERIRNLIPAGILDDSTRLVLTNAIYVKAPWAVPLRPGSTQSGFFYRLDGSPVSVPFMTGLRNGWYASGDGWQAVELPYAGGELAMTVVLPASGAFRTMDGGLSGMRLAEITGALKPSEADLRLPRWTFRTQAPLKSVLQAMGMSTAFDDRKADFSGMTKEEHLFIALHRGRGPRGLRGSRRSRHRGGGRDGGSGFDVVGPSDASVDDRRQAVPVPDPRPAYRGSVVSRPGGRSERELRSARRGRSGSTPALSSSSNARLQSSSSFIVSTLAT